MWNNNSCHGCSGSGMKLLLLTKPLALLAVTLSSTFLFILLSQPQPDQSSGKPDSMARSFILWLHGLGDSGPANEPIKTLFTSPEFRNAIWSFPSAPSNPVTCNCTFSTCTISGSYMNFALYLWFILLWLRVDDSNIITQVALFFPCLAKIMYSFRLFRWHYISMYELRYCNFSGMGWE